MLGFLFSFHYTRKTDMDALLAPLSPAPPLFADSGAYSAHTVGAAITVDEYAQWVRRWAHLFPVYANLDVLDDPKKSAVNMGRLERKGLAPVPVFHGGEDWRYLEGMADRYDYIALGGITRFRDMPVLTGWFDRCFRICEGKAQLHGFGMTRWELVKRFPWRSVDSSSIGSGYRYGSVKVYDGYGRRWTSWRVADRRAWGKHGWLVREYGMTPQDFEDQDGTRQRSTRALILLATRSMARAVQDLAYGQQVYLVDAAMAQREYDGATRIQAFNDVNKETSQ